MIDLNRLSASELLALYAEVSQNLQDREITRSANNPTGDLAELLFCKAFGWSQENNSKKGYDALDGKTRYQIKARRLKNGKGSRQLSALRDLHGKHFDFLAAVIFNQNYSVWRAAIIPYSLVCEHVRKSNHTNSHLFLLKDFIWENPMVKDVTENLRGVIL